jgi:hypothetical protein
MPNAEQDVNNFGAKLFTDKAFGILSALSYNYDFQAP